MLSSLWNYELISNSNNWIMTIRWVWFWLWIFNTSRNRIPSLLMLLDSIFVWFDFDGFNLPVHHSNSQVSFYAALVRSRDSYINKSVDPYVNGRRFCEESSLKNLYHIYFKYLRWRERSCGDRNCDRWGSHWSEKSHKILPSRQFQIRNYLLYGEYWYR